MSDRGSNSAPHKKCLGCAYILDHLPENRCPECGRAFDPEDPLTFTSDDPSLALARSGMSLLTWACIGSLLLLSPLIWAIGAYTLGVNLNSGTFADSLALPFMCGFPVGFVIDVIVALRVSRASRRGYRSRWLTAAGWIAAGPFALIPVFFILGGLIELIDWIANRW